MDRREFVKLAPLGSAAVAASLTVPEDEKNAITFDVSVLRVKRGDVVVLTAPGFISDETADRLKKFLEFQLETLGASAWILGDGLKVDGVLRGA